MSEEQCYKLILWLLRFPKATICKHAVASQILNELERIGLQVRCEVVKAVADGDDESAIQLVEEKIKDIIFGDIQRLLN